MPEQPDLPPVPDALRENRPARREPKVDIFNDPLNPVEEPPVQKVPDPATDDDEKKEKPASGLADLDAPSAFVSMLASGIGRAIALVLTCMLTFGLTMACYKVSLIFKAWSIGGFKAFVKAIFAVPGSIFTAPWDWFASLGLGILEPLGVPYLLLFVCGLIIAVRSDFDVVKLLFFYAIASAIHAAAFFKLTDHPFSLLLWLGVVAGIIWLNRWYWRQQILVEENDESEVS